MAKKYITDKLSAKTASSGITYEGDAVFNGGPDGTFSFNFNNGATSEFSVNFEGDDFLTVNGGTGVFEVGDIAGLFDGFYLKVDPSNNLLSWKASQDDLVTFAENSTVSLYGTGTNNASGAEINILKGQSNEVTGKLKLNSTTQYLDLEYEDPGATNSLRLYRDYGYISSPLRIGANAAANELDDYEEGTFDFQFRVSNTYYDFNTTNFQGGSTQFYNYSRYVKVGRKVTLYFDIRWSTVPWGGFAGGTAIWLVGLPFTLSTGSSTTSAGAGGTYNFGSNPTLSSSAAAAESGAVSGRFYHSGSGIIYLTRNYYVSGYYSAWYTGSVIVQEWPGNDPGSAQSLKGMLTYYTTD